MNPENFISAEIGLDTEKLWNLIKESESKNRYDGIYPILFFNESFPLPTDYTIPSYILSAADCSPKTISWTLCPTDMIHNFSVTAEQAKDFLAGEPILIWVHALRHRQLLGRGGRSKDAVESEVRAALAVTLRAVIERLLLLEEIKGKRRHGNTAAMLNPIETKIIDQWYETKYLERIDIEDEDTINDINVILEEDDPRNPKKPYKSMFNSLIHEGRKISVWSLFYPQGDLKAYSKFWKQQYKCWSATDLKEEIEFQTNLVNSLFKLNFRAKSKFEAEYLLSKSARNKEPLSQSTLNQVAGTSARDHVTPLEALRAAFAGDFDASRTCLNLTNAIDYLHTMRLIGRLSRGVDNVIFDPTHLSVLRPAIEIVERWNHSPWAENDNHSTEQAFWARAMLRTMPLSEWKRQFN